MEWHEVWITDKSDRRFFNETSDPLGTPGTIREKRRKIQLLLSRPDICPMIDRQTIKVMLDGEEYATPSPAESDESLLSDLGISLD